MVIALLAVQYGDSDLKIEMGIKMNNVVFEKTLALDWGCLCDPFFGAFVLGGMIPVPGPSLSPDQVAGNFDDHRAGMRIGMVMMVFAAACYAAFVAIGAAQTSRIPGVSKSAIYCQLVGGSVSAVTFMIPAFFWIVATFRLDRSVELIQFANDLAYVAVVFPWMPFLVQNWAFAYAILNDNRDHPLLPRWLAFINLWGCVVYSPAILLPFFKTGPFAWNGIFVFYIPGLMFTIWFVAMSVMLSKAVDRN